MKKIIISLVLISALLFPITVSYAQTTDNSIYSLQTQLIALLEQMVAQLTSQLNALIAAQNTKISNIQSQVNSIVSSTSIVSTSTNQNVAIGSIPDTLVSSSTIINSIVSSTPEDKWIDDNEYMVSDQFALDSNVKYHILATSTFEFTISGRMVKLETNKALQTPDKWWPVVNTPLTITYGNQSQTGITDNDGVVKLKFHSIGVPGKYRFKYSSSVYPLNACGPTNECGNEITELPINNN